MTVSYSAEVPNGSSFGCFWRILCKWRGSVYKLVWRELLAYLFLYYSINFIYRYALNEQQQRVFEKIRSYFGAQSETIPMSFVLGFYVSLVVKRWWEQYRLLPWPDTLALYISAGIPGADERGRLMRRNIVRYAVLAYVITLQRVSLRVKRRFPTWQHVVDSGLMMESEKKIIEMMDGRSPMSKYWMPLVWATNIINRARKESLITSDHIVQTLLQELSDIRRRLGGLIGYDTVCVPLVYTQVVTLALYSYFIAALLGRQIVPNLENPKGSYEEPDMYFPFFTALQFCFYVGWLKVAEVLINPFGEDDDDIELNWLIDRHIKAAYMIVDEMHEEHPELLRDQYWEEVVPKDLPYTVASEHYRREEPKGSAELYKVKQADAMYANLSTVHHHHGGRKMTADDMYADYESVDTPIVERRKNWFARQITRMGSVRSSSTAYSSGGLFNRTRHNSVYANPEVGQSIFGQPTSGTNNNGTHQQHKMSLYDRLVGRRSSRGQRQIGRQGTGKHNGASTAMAVRNRPRIPTPDVTKEVLDREHRLNSIGGGITTSVGGQVNPVTLMAHQLNSAYPGSDVPVVQVVLQPIQEMDGSGSHNNTLHAGQPGTAALAQAVLSPALTSAGIGPVIAANLTPVTVSQLSSLGLTVTTNSNTNSPLLTRSDLVGASPSLPSNLTLTELNPQILNELTSTARASPVTINEFNSDDDGNKSTGGSSAGTEEKTVSRKTSVTSQVTAPAGSPKRSEVYV